MNRRDLLQVSGLALALGLLPTGKAFSFVQKVPRATFVTSIGAIVCDLAKRESGLWETVMKNNINGLVVAGGPLIHDALGALRPEFPSGGKQIILLSGDTITLTVRDPEGLL